MDFFHFEIKDIHGHTFDFEKLKGAKCFLIVNVASQWGLTKSNYTALSQIYAELAEEGLEILGFPCNQFGSQEPWPEEKVLEFVQKNFNVKFPMFSKIDVNEPGTHPLYQYLKNNKVFKHANELICKNEAIEDIPWNFAKFLVDKHGKVTHYYGPKVHPDNIVPDIKKHLSHWKKFETTDRSLWIAWVWCSKFDEHRMKKLI